MYVTAIAIIMLPIYIKYMGAEAYGLVGFFMMLQAWFGLLDFGLAPTIVRETARYHSGVMSALEYRRLYRALSVIFLIIATIGGGTLYLLSRLVATRWLNVEILSLDTVTVCVQLMALSVAMRWMCCLYRAVVTGNERLTWLSGFNAIVATFRFVAVLPVMWYFGVTPIVFFIHQFLVALAELLWLYWKCQELLPSREKLKAHLGWSFKPVRAVLKFSLTSALTSSVWVLVTQTDKLLLSKLLLLQEYAYFSLAVLVASGIMVIGVPISTALLPRMAKVNASGDEVRLIRLYRNASQLVAVVAIPATLILAMFSENVLFSWTGDVAISRSAGPVLALYALGNGILALSSLPYYLQFAKGDLKLHLVGSGLFAVTLIPMLILATLSYGPVGAGYAWLTSNALYFLFWIPRVHRRFAGYLHWKWLFNDLGSIILFSVTGVILVNGLLKWPAGRLAIGACVVVIALFLLSIAAVGSSWVRENIGGKWRAYFA